MPDLCDGVGGSIDIYIKVRVGYVRVWASLGKRHFLFIGEKCYLVGRDKVGKSY